MFHPLMSETFKSFLQRWLINTLAVLVATNIVSGIHYDSLTGLIVATLILGILNALVRPILILLSAPIMIVTLGLFILVINAILLYAVGHMLKTFHVNSFWAAFWGALIISIVSLILNTVTRSGGSRIEIRRGRNGKRRDDGDGPVIDV